MRTRFPILAALAALFLSAAAEPGAGAADRDERDAVAMISGFHSEVKVRRSQELGWVAAFNGLRLYNHDAVKTGPGGGATISFNDSTQLRVEAESMVIVLDTGLKVGTRESAVLVPEGKVHGSVRKNLERPVELVVRTSRGWIHADSKTDNKEGSAFRASVSPGEGLKVRSESGDVKLMAQGRERVLQPKEELRVAPTQAGGEAAADAEKGVSSDLPELSDAEWPAPASPAARKRGQAPEPKQAPAPRAAASHEKVHEKDSGSTHSEPKKATKPSPRPSKLPPKEVLSAPTVNEPTVEEDPKK